MYNNKIGVIYQLPELLKYGTEKLIELDIETVQLLCWDVSLYTTENAIKIKKMLEEAKIQLTSFWAGWSGPAVWDSIDGPITLGLVPEAYRFQRLQDLMKGADFASLLGSPNITTHVGFIPEHPTFAEYRGVVQAVKYIAEYCKSKNLGFHFETGQETPVTLMRLIKDVGNPNLGINLDPANLILYGRGNPIDAAKIFEDYIKGVHIKDADYSKDFYHLGEERVVGEGSVNFPVFISNLLKQGYKGDLYIEREISGDQQIEDIKQTVKYIKDLVNLISNEEEIGFQTSK